MAKNALVVTGADFSTNKLTTVTIETENVPCTGISLSDSTKTVTSLGEFTLTANVTPQDTTDSVIWTTSDSTVATVASGVVNVVGLGTATITATCGNQTATCAVSCTELTINPYYMFAKRQNLANYPNIPAVATSKRELACGDNTILETVRRLKNQSSNTALDACPFLLPPNTGIVELSYGKNMRAGTIYFSWVDTQQAGDSSYPNIAYLVELDSTNSTVYNQSATWQYEKPEGADSFTFTVTTNSVDFAETDTPAGIAEEKEIVVKCKPSAS